MKIIDRYIITKVIFSYLLLAASFLSLYIIIDLFSHIQGILEKHLQFSYVLKYYIFFLPQIFIRVSPLSFLISALYLLGTLNRNNEILSLRVQGIGIGAIVRMFVIPALLLSVLSLFIEDRVIPKTAGYLKENKLSHNSISFSADKVDNFAFYSNEGYIIFAKTFSPKEGIMDDVNIFAHTPSGEIKKEIAAEQLFYSNGKWKLKNASSYRLEKNELIPSNTYFNKEEPLSLSEPPDRLLEASQLKWQELSLKDLKKEIFKFTVWNTSKIVTLLNIEFNRKIALSFSTLFILLGGLPFALIIRKRRVGLSSLGIAVIMSFIYYFFFSMSSSLGKVNFFPPFVACWLPNIFFGISGIIGLVSLI